MSYASFPVEARLHPEPRADPRHRPEKCIASTHDERLPISRWRNYAPRRSFRCRTGRGVLVQAVARVKIAVVADTHMPRFAKVLPLALREGFAAERVELILHLGDFTEPQVADAFAALAPFDAVAGNNDGAELVARFGRRKLLDVGGARIGMTHGDGARGSTLVRALAAFAGQPVDVILFGHSHTPYCERHGTAWVMNPGSPTDKRRNPHYSWGVLDIRDGVVVPSLRYYDDKHA